MNVTDELQKLQQLHQTGAINDDEFARAKARLLNDPPPVSTAFQGLFGDAGPATLEQRTRQWALFLHLSQFAGYLVPLAGLIVPIVIWQLKKDELPGIDDHGKVVVNWIISALLYAIVCVILIFVFIGIPLLIVLCILAIIFPIVGAIKGNNGEVWRYPLSITFFK